MPDKEKSILTNSPRTIGDFVFNQPITCAVLQLLSVFAQGWLKTTGQTIWTNDDPPVFTKDSQFMVLFFAVEEFSTKQPRPLQTGDKLRYVRIHETDDRWLGIEFYTGTKAQYARYDIQLVVDAAVDIYRHLAVS